MRIAVDIDDVLFPFVDSLRYWLNKIHGVPLEQLTDPMDWDLSKEWGIPQDELWSVAGDFIDKGLLLHQGPYPGAAEALQKLAGSGHSIHLITARSGGKTGVVHRDTMIWLADHEIYYDTLSFAQDKSVLRVDWSIDDRPENCEAFREAGAMPILMDRPWNKAYRGWRVPDMTSFAEIVCYTTG